MRSVRSLLVGLLLAVGLGALAAPAVAYPSGQIATAQINSTVFAPGATVTVTVEHTTPGPLTMLIFSAPVTIGTGTVGPDSSGAVSGVVPDGYSGPHTIQVRGAGGEVFTFAITVTAPQSGSRVEISTGCQNPPVDSTDGFVQVTVDNFTPSDESYRVEITPGVADRTLDIPAGQSDSVFVADLANGDYVVSVFGGTLPADGSPAPLVVACTAPTSPPTSPPPPTIAPTSQPSATATVTVIGSDGGAGRGGGSLASTGAQVALGSGVGLVALLAGGVLLLVGRRRSTPRHGG